MKVAILGSCVTKQPFECQEGGAYLLPNPVLYDARSSLISLTSDPLEPVDLWLDLCNEWEREWMLRDFQKSFWSRLPADLDVLVMDLIDERRDLLEAGGRYTLEAPDIELWRDRGNRPEDVGFSRIPRADADPLWDDAVRAFFHRLRQTAPGARVIVHRALCAVRRDDETIVSNLWWTVSTNAILERYYDAIARIAPEVTFVEAPSRLRRQKSGHKYGPAPFHFIDEYDLAIARSIREVLDRAAPSDADASTLRGATSLSSSRGSSDAAAPARRGLDWSAHPQSVDGLGVQAVHDGFMVSHPGDERGHFLNPTAALLLGFCDGQVAASDLPALLQAAFRLPDPPVGEVAQCLEQFFDEGLVR